MIQCISVNKKQCFIFFILIHVAHGLSFIPGKSPVQIMYDSSQTLHRCIEYHPEQPERINVCVERLQKYQQEHADSNFEVLDVSPRKDHKHNQVLAEDELMEAREMLAKVHSEEFVSSVETKCRSSRQRRVDEGKPPLGFIGYIDADTFLTTESYDVFLHATAIWIRAVKNVLSSQSLPATTAASSKVSSSMALTRPPGHHATQKVANGFCVFNFAAAAAKYAIDRKLATRVSILDWDVHYGQGVADIVKKEENIRYVSLHQCPAFPYQGESLQVDGEYQNVYTVPIMPGMTWETGYKDTFVDMALPFIYTEKANALSTGGEWVPDLVIVCAGYDALGVDELASVNLNPSDFGEMTRLIQQRIGGGEKQVGLVLGLEGGYQLKDDEKGLSAAVLESIKALSQE